MEKKKDKIDKIVGKILADPIFPEGTIVAQIYYDDFRMWEKPKKPKRK